MKPKTTRSSFVLCIRSTADNFELLVGKVYRVKRRAKNDGASDLRVIDESGEDYLYPAAWFVPITLPTRARRALAAPSA